MFSSRLPFNPYFAKKYKILQKIDNRKQFVTKNLFNEQHHTISLKKKCATIGEILASNYVSIF